MKKTFFLTMLFIAASSTMAQQSFAGFRNGTFSGTLQVLTNPSFIVGQPRKWDVNLYSAAGSFGTNEFKFEVGDIKKNIVNFNKSNSFNTISGNAVTDWLLPSFSFKLGEKNAIALTTRMRILANLDNVNTKIIETAIETKVDKIENLPYTTDLQNQAILLNSFSEVGLTYATTLLSTPNHKINAGLTAKYVIGSANQSIYIQNTTATLESDVASNRIFITNASGTFEYIASGIDFQDFKLEKIKENMVSSWGLDVGFSYEYRNNPDDQKYRIRAGVSISDIGELKYKNDKNRSGRYTVTNLSTQKILFSDFENALKDSENGVSQEFFTNEEYAISLPTALQSSIDIRVSDNWYVELYGLKGISKKANNNRNPYYTDEVVVTPRYENKFFGVYVPMKYNEISKLNIGTAFRLGSIFFGSSTVLSNSFAKGKQIDVFLGIRFGK